MQPPLGSETPGSKCGVGSAHSNTQPLTDYFYVTILWYMPIQAAVRVKTKFCGLSNAGIAGSNTADGIGFLCSKVNILCDLLL
jgi:hypothetical protein